MEGQDVLGLRMGQTAAQGFLPQEDQGTFFIQISLPQAASLSRLWQLAPLGLLQRRAPGSLWPRQYRPSFQSDHLA